MRRRFLSFIPVTMVLLAIGALPAAANHMDSATVTADCNGYTINVAGSVNRPGVVNYNIVLAPPASPITGSISVTPNPDLSFTGSATHSWAEYGVTLSGNTCMSGSATLVIDLGPAGTIPIAFTPTCLDCGTTTCTGTIGDFVWSDSNCNGIQDFAEPGTNGVTVRLMDSSGQVVATTVTAPGPALQNGYYQFGNLCGGTYTVVVDTSTLPAGSVAAACTAGTDRTKDNNCSPAVVGLPANDSSDQTIDFGYCTSVGKTFRIGPSSMEGHLTILPGDWISGGYSFKFKSGSHAATQFNVRATVALTVTCPKGGGAGGTMVIDLGAKSYAVPALNTAWLPTGDANNVLSWMGSAQAPDLCNGYPMDNARGAVFTATVSQNPTTGSLVDFRFKYRDPNAKGKGNVNCLDTTDPRRAKADVCGASWSGTITDP